MKIRFYNTINPWHFFSYAYSAEYGWLYLFGFTKSIGFHFGKHHLIH